MKTATILIFAFTILITASSIHAQTTDLSMREALYFTGLNSTSINLAKDLYVAKGATVNLSSELAKSCDKTGCEFNIGYLGFRTGDTSSALSSYGLISIEGGGMVGNTIFFSAAETTKQAVLPLKLRVGMNRLTFTIDPYKKTRETNENNNSHTAYVVLASPRFK